MTKGHEELNRVVWRLTPVNRCAMFCGVDHSKKQNKWLEQKSWQTRNLYLCLKAWTSKVEQGVEKWNPKKNQWSGWRLNFRGLFLGRAEVVHLPKPLYMKQSQDWKSVQQVVVNPQCFFVEKKEEEEEILEDQRRKLGLQWDHKAFELV